jgi:SP family general alpha glucoside:H+ symporter-like MFS transporter
VARSPWWLIRRGEHKRARDALHRLYRPGTVEQRLSEISETIAESLSEKKAEYADCFRGTDLRRTLIAVAVFVIQPLSGGPFVTGYQTYYLQLAGLPVDQTYTLTGANYAVMLVGNCIGMYLCERVGRRPTMLWGSFGLTILLVFIGVLGSIPVHATVYPQVVFMSLWGLVYQVTIGAVGWAISAEVSTNRLRGATQALCTMTNVGPILSLYPALENKAYLRI